MSVYSDLHQIIVDDTKRAEMSDPAITAGGNGIIRRRIQRAVQRYHRMDFWKKDFNLQEYGFQMAGFVQVMSLNSFPRLRAVGFIRSYDPTLVSLYQQGLLGRVVGNSYEEINPEKVLDVYGYDRRDTMYRAGNEIHINSTISIQSVLVGWYEDPMLEPIEVSASWIMKDYPSLIAADVKMRIFKDIGKDEENRSAAQELMIEVGLLQTNNVRLTVM